MTNLSGTNLNNGAAVGPQGEGRDSPSRFLAYPMYKDSGDEWLGKVPEHWQALALSRVLAAPVTDGPHTTPEFLDNGVPFLSVDGIQDGKLNFEGCRYVSLEDHKEFSKKAAPRHNDLLMGKAASIGKIARVTEDIEFSIWSPLALIRVDAGQCSPEFLEFCLKSSELQHQILLASNSNTQLNIGMKDIPKLRIPLPAVQEQTQIARFLDHETARIDALIEEQQRLIELLKEKRQAVISHAVTKGLDPTVPMKDSGVEWLGEVPAHWNVGALRWYATIQGGIAKGKDYEGRETVVMPYLRVANVQSGFVDLTEVKEISVLESEVERYSLRAGDVLMNEGGDNDKLGRGTVWQAQIEPCLHQNHVFAIRPNGLLRAEWLATFTQSEQARTYFYLNSKQSTNLASISASNVMSLALPIPSVSEQQEILAYLEEDRERHEQLAGVAISTVELLQERRSALISAAVTGKIDVRGWQRPASTQAPESAVAEAN